MSSPPAALSSLILTFVASIMLMPSGQPNQQTIPIVIVPATGPVVVVLVVEVVVVEVVVVWVVVVEVVVDEVVVVPCAQPKIPTTKAKTTSMLPIIHSPFVFNLKSSFHIFGFCNYY